MLRSPTVAEPATSGQSTGEARHAYDKSIAINPNEAEALVYRAGFLSFIGEGNEALECLEEVFRLDPMYPDWFLDWAFIITLVSRDAPRASELAQEAPKDTWPEMPGWLAIAHAHVGEVEEAQRLAQQFVSNVRRSWIGEGTPDAEECVRWLFIDNPFRREEDREWLIEGLRIAGLSV